MQDIINDTTPAEAIILLTFSIRYIISRKDRRHYFLIYSTVLILYTTLLRRTAGAFSRPMGPASTARLELLGFNLSGFLLIALLFLLLGFSLKKYQFTPLGMFDVWDLLANTIVGLAGKGIALRWREKR